MNEQIARDVVLVRAIEAADHKREILSDDDRMYASRSAKELAQWQAHSAGTEVTPDQFLQQRSEQILKRIAERMPAFASFLKHRELLRSLAVALPVLALILGVGMDRIGDPHRVDLLSAPLLAIIGWNLVVYVSLVVSLFFLLEKRFGITPACCAYSLRERRLSQESCRTRCRPLCLLSWPSGPN